MQTLAFVVVITAIAIALVLWQRLVMMGMIMRLFWWLLLALVVVVVDMNVRL